MSENEEQKKGLFYVLKDFFNPHEWIKTLRSIPAVIFALCVLANVLMNILANKSIINLPYLVQDAGIVLSWIGFLAGDLLVRAFGTKNAIRANITALLISIFISGLLLATSLIPGDWSPVFENGEEYTEVINSSINEIIANQWYVILGSALASTVGLISNNLIQGTMLKSLIKKHGDHYIGYLFASAMSTIVGQFLDNLVFASVISLHFFGWTVTQVFMCSIFGALLELVVEMVFTPLTYRISLNWQKNGIGTEWIK